MKFTDGFWVTKPGFELFNAAQVQDVQVYEDHVMVWVSRFPIRHRGMTLSGPLLTLRISAPREDILSLKLSHFTGSAKKEPAFPLALSPCPLFVEQDEDMLRVSAGKLSLVIKKEQFSLDYYYEGKRLTGLRDRHMGYATTPEGPFMRVKLDIGVGEKIYGLGERFTAFVKNGQTVDIWNEDGGTSSELAYKNIPFYVTNRGYGVFVNSPGKVSYELCSEAVASAQFSLPGEELEFMVIGGPGMREAVSRFTALTGRPALPPAWSFGLWLSTSFTTDYSEKTVTEFVATMRERGIPLHVFHFDCFWMKEYRWCDFEWDRDMFPDPEGMLSRLKAMGLKICVWINPYIGQKSPLFEEGRQNGYLLKRPNGDVWQWDMWQPGMGLVDFTNPDACAWYAGKLKALLDMGVDCFKTDFGERIPVDCVYHDGSDPQLMHNYYTHLYNKTVFDLLVKERGEGEACLFARSATVGGQQFPVHWGGDSSSNYPSMAESLRAGLSLCSCGFGFWSHDIGGFEDTASPDVYKRWAAFGLLGSHSRLHGSTSYRVPWAFGEEAVEVVRRFTRLKCRLMPYLFAAAVEAHRTGIPVMRPMVMAFPDDRGCEDLDRQYMLGENLLVAPVMRADNIGECYLPEGRWTHLLSNKVYEGGRWLSEEYDFFSLPLFVRPGSLLAMGSSETEVDYDYASSLQLHAFELEEGVPAQTIVYDSRGKQALTLTVTRRGGEYCCDCEGKAPGLTLHIHEEGKPVSVREITPAN